MTESLRFMVIETDKMRLESITMKGLIFLTLVVVFQISSPTWSYVGLTPAPLLKWADEGADYAILVDKSAQKVFLYHRDDVSGPVKVYRCSTGENSGPKSRRNDRKTPEGVYFFRRSYMDRELSPIYGVRAFSMDYPNPLDKRQGKGGYGIWFHGTNEPLKPRDTNGCVVLENGSIEDLSNYIRLNETPVIISSDIERIPSETQKQESAVLQKFVETWAQVWEDKDIDQYMNLYSPHFVARGMDWRRWKAYKSRLAKKYNKIHVNIENLELFGTNGIVLARFHQTYRTASFKSHGQKRLYLAKNSNQWRIIGEFFEKEKIRKRSFPSRTKTDLKEIEAFVFAWKSAWEKKDLENYIGVYDRTFRSSGMDLKAWKRYKSGLNLKYGSLNIRVSGIKIIKDSGNRLVVRFRQEYRADAYSDSGIKDLYLVKRGTQWKIRKETWRRLTPSRTRP